MTSRSTMIRVKTNRIFFLVTAPTLWKQEEEQPQHNWKTIINNVLKHMSTFGPIAYIPVEKYTPNVAITKVSSSMKTETQIDSREHPPVRLLLIGKFFLGANHTFEKTMATSTSNKTMKDSPRVELQKYDSSEEDAFDLSIENRNMTIAKLTMNEERMREDM